MDSVKDDGVEIIDLTPDSISDYGVCGYKDAKKHVELKRKIDWYRDLYPKGLRIKAVVSKDGGYQGMIEYIPGEYAHRPVDAAGYFFIHCVFVGFRKEFKGKGFASGLIDNIVEEARNENKIGVAVVTRKGSFMARKDIFLKKGFEVVEEARPDFELLAKKFDDNGHDPCFKDMKSSLQRYNDGLYILRSVQCPYTEKNVNAILETAREDFGIEPKLIEMDSPEAVQDSPCPFGVFCIVLDGEIISHHPISNTRFGNIMKKSSI